MTPRVSAAKVQNIHSLANTPEEGGRVGLTGAGNAACTGNTTLAGTGKCYRATTQQKQALLLPTLSRRNWFRQEDNMSSHLDRKKNDVTPMFRSRKIQKGS